MRVFNNSAHDLSPYVGLKSGSRRLRRQNRYRNKWYTLKQNLIGKFRIQVSKEQQIVREKVVYELKDKSSRSMTYENMINHVREQADEE